MIIPTGISHIAFYQQAKRKGIKINSRYQGVNMSQAKDGLRWTAKIYQNKKLVFCKTFPFTEEGEKQASEAYEQFHIANNIEKRYKTKRSRHVTKRS